MTANASANEVEIREKFASGDSDALRQVLELFGPVVARTLATRFGVFLSHEDVEDILGIALYKLWAARARYDPSRPLFPWFYLIARNVAIDSLREKRRQPEWFHLTREGERRVEQLAASGKVRPGRTAVLLEQLEEVLQSLPAPDQAILLDFAMSEDSRNWTAETAKRLSKTPNHVRVRKQRLMELVRKRLSLPHSGTAPEEIDFMERFQHLAKLWDRFQPQFREMATQLREVHSRAVSKGPNDPEQVFARAWNASQDDDSLKDEQYRRILQRTYCWIQGLLRQSQDSRERILGFAEQCSADYRLRDATLYQNAPEMRAERLLRAVGGVTNAIEEQMPDSVRSEQHGKLLVEWEKSGPWLNGLASWRVRDAKEPLPLLPAARSSLRLYAELPARESEVFADHLLSAMRDRRVDLPDFIWKEGNKQHTVFEWYPKGVLSISEKNAPGADDRLREDLDLLPFPIELDFWQRHPDAAQAVDDALLKAVVADEQSRQSEIGTPEENDRPLEASEVEQVVRALQELTGHTTEDVVLLLTPRLEKRVQEECESASCTAYRHALEFLASHLSQH